MQVKYNCRLSARGNPDLLFICVGKKNGGSIVLNFWLTPCGTAVSKGKEKRSLA